MPLKKGAIVLFVTAAVKSGLPFLLLYYVATCEPLVVGVLQDGSEQSI